MRPDGFCGLRRLPAIFLIALMGIGVAEVRSDDLERKLLDCSPTILKYLDDRGYQNVGILKFRGRRGEGAASDNLGMINLTLADRLERALILKVKPHLQKLGIVHEASKTAAKIAGAGHLTSEGRAKLFTAEYPLAWNAPPVVPDAFLTGLVEISDDLQKLRVGIIAFDRRSQLDKVIEFTAKIDPLDLLDAGESYFVRGALDTDDEQLAQVTLSPKVIAAAEQVNSQRQLHPLQDPDAPVFLEIHYDGRSVPLEFREGRAFIREPLEGQRVTFVLKHNSQRRLRCGSVVKVNGLNTIRRQRLPDSQCKMWILDSGDEPVEITGFLMNDDRVEAFKVLSAQDSKAREVNYGADVGTITLSVFRADASETPAMLAQQEDPDIFVLSRGSFPDQPPRNLEALRSQLHQSAIRGLIEAGEVSSQAVNVVKFIPYPVPIMAATIVYYRP